MKGYKRLAVINVFVIVFLRLAIVIVLVTCNVGDAAATTTRGIHLSILAGDATYGTISFRGRVVHTSGIGGVEATLVSSPKHGVWFKHRSRRDESSKKNDGKSLVDEIAERVSVEKMDDHRLNLIDKNHFIDNNCIGNFITPSNRHHQ
jgi:hypothetical protein